jgi:hypothetical protein
MVVGVRTAVHDRVVDELGDEQPEHVLLLASQDLAELLDDALARCGRGMNASGKVNPRVPDDARKPVVVG